MPDGLMPSASVRLGKRDGRGGGRESPAREGWGSRERLARGGGARAVDFVRQRSLHHAVEALLIAVVHALRPEERDRLRPTPPLPGSLPAEDRFGLERRLRELQLGAAGWRARAQPEREHRTLWRSETEADDHGAVVPGP